MTNFVFLLGETVLALPLTTYMWRRSAMRPADARRSAGGRQRRGHGDATFVPLAIRVACLVHCESVTYERVRANLQTASVTKISRRPRPTAFASYEGRARPDGD